MMILGGIFSRSRLREPLDLSGIRTDMHSHLIPGIDDGVMTTVEAIRLIKSLKEMGYKKIITTPHIQNEFYRNTPEIISNGLENLKEKLNDEGIDIEIEAAAEYRLDEGFEEKMKDGSLMTFGDRYLLVELSYYNPHPDLKNLIFNLQVEGYKVILAHPERYSYWFDSWEKFTELKERNVFLQLNAVSLAGFYPDPVSKIAKKFIDEGMIEFLGTDIHNDNYLKALQASRMEKSLKRLIDSGKLLNNTL